LKIGIASDHAATHLKERIRLYLEDHGYTIEDYGPEVTNNKSVDYPDFASKALSPLLEGKLDRVILMCGTGIGMSISANRFIGIRAALVTDEFMARSSREHNDANVLVLGARTINHDRALDYLDIWLKTEYEGGRHQKRLDKIDYFAKNIQI